MKYNDLHVPPIIRTDRIISAFENPLDYDKLENYKEQFKRDMLSHSFPPIKGYPHIVDENDIGSYFMCDVDDYEPIEAHHIGQFAWKVTDGHHRSAAARSAGLPHIEVELDYTCITDPEQLKQFY